MEPSNINKILLKQGGRSITGQQMYRVVFSDDQMEHRHGTFRDFTESGLFIREITETRLTRKYNFIHGRYIFEKWAPGELTQCPETPNAKNGDYICVYVFEDKDGKSLLVTIKSVMFLLNVLKGNRVEKDEVPSQEYLEAKQEEEDIISMDTHPVFSTSGPTRNAVAYTRGLKNA